MLFATSTESILTVALTCSPTVPPSFARRRSGGRGGVPLYALDPGSRLLEFVASAHVVDDMQVLAVLHLWEVLHVRAHLGVVVFARSWVLHRDLALGLIDGDDWTVASAAPSTLRRALVARQRSRRPTVRLAPAAIAARLESCLDHWLSPPSVFWLGR